MRLHSVILLGLCLSVFIVLANPAYANPGHVNADFFNRTNVGSSWDDNGAASITYSIINKDFYRINDNNGGLGGFTNTSIETGNTDSLHKIVFHIRPSASNQFGTYAVANGDGSNSNNRVIDIRFADTGNVAYVNSTGTQVNTGATFSGNVWYKHEIIFNLSNSPKTYTLLIDGTPYLEDEIVWHNLDLTTFSFNTAAGSTGYTLDLNDGYIIQENTTGLVADIVNELTEMSLETHNITLFNATDNSLIDVFEGDGFGHFVRINDSGEYNALMTKDGFKSVNQTFTHVAGVDTLILFTTRITPSINISFFDELNQERLTGINYKLIFDDFATEANSSSESSLFIDLNNTGELEIEYSRPEYFQRHYFLNITAQTNASINLYLLNNTESNHNLVSYTIGDQDGTALTDVTLKVLRRYVVSGVPQFEVVEMSKSDVNGEGGIYLEQNDGTYKFFVEKNGVIILTTEENQVFQNSISLRADLAESVITSTVGTTELNVTFSFVEATLSLTTNWNDPSGITTQLCVDIKQIARKITVVNDTCGTGSTGSVVLGLPNITGNYVVYATQITNTEFSDKPAGTFSITLADIKEAIGVSGLFYLMMFTVMGALIGMSIFQNSTATIALTVVGFIIGILFRITELGWVAAMSTVLIGGFLIYSIRKFGGTGA